MEKFAIGLALGMVGGALLVANNCKIRTLVKKNQDEVMQKVEKYVDGKLDEMKSDPDGDDGAEDL